MARDPNEIGQVDTSPYPPTATYGNDPAATSAPPKPNRPKAKGMTIEWMRNNPGYVAKRWGSFANNKKMKEQLAWAGFYTKETKNGTVLRIKYGPYKDKIIWRWGNPQQGGQGPPKDTPDSAATPDAAPPPDPTAGVDIPDVSTGDPGGPDDLGQFEFDWSGPDAAMNAYKQRLKQYQLLNPRKFARTMAGLEFDPQITALIRQIQKLEKQIPFNQKQIRDWFGFDDSMGVVPYAQNPNSIMAAIQRGQEQIGGAYDAAQASVRGAGAGAVGAIGDVGGNLVMNYADAGGDALAADKANWGAFNAELSALAPMQAAEMQARMAGQYRDEIGELRAGLGDLRKQKGAALTANQFAALERDIAMREKMIDYEMAKATAGLSGFQANVDSTYKAEQLKDARAGRQLQQAELNLSRAELQLKKAAQAAEAQGQGDEFWGDPANRAQVVGALQSNFKAFQEQMGWRVGPNGNLQIETAKGNNQWVSVNPGRVRKVLETQLASFGSVPPQIANSIINAVMSNFYNQKQYPGYGKNTKLYNQP